MGTRKLRRGRTAATLGAAAVMIAALSACQGPEGRSTVGAGTIGGAGAGAIAGRIISSNPWVIAGGALVGGVAGNQLIDKPATERQVREDRAAREASRDREAQRQEAARDREQQRKLDYERQSALQEEEVRREIEEQRLFEECERVQQDQAEAVDVSSAQRLLKAHGLYQGPIDGIFGPGTEQAVRQFEAKQGSPQTGKLTPTLMSQMRATL